MLLCRRPCSLLFTDKNQGRRIVVCCDDPFEQELPMLCPRCGTNQSDEMNFCKVCGANLEAVRQALVNPEAMKRFDASDNWLAEMFRSGQAAELRKIEMERQMGITPEVKRYIEIKAGVITSAVGLGVAIFLYVFMQGVVLGNVSPQAAEIVS